MRLAKKASFELDSGEWPREDSGRILSGKGAPLSLTIGLSELRRVDWPASMGLQDTHYTPDGRLP